MRTTPFIRVIFLVFTFSLVTSCSGDSNSNSPPPNPTTIADVTPPVISLSGEKSISLQVNSTYDEMGANATDDMDGNVFVEITGAVDTEIEGTYYLTYSAKDSAGNMSEITRIVNIVNTEQTVSVILDVEELDIEINDGFSIVTPNEVILLDTSTETFNVAQQNEESKFVVMLVNENNIPVLMGVNNAKIQNEISIESTAVVFVLRQANFIGIEITDYQALTSRISANESFAQLKSIITNNINTGSPCPLKPECNYVAEQLAATIASEIEFAGLIKDQGL